MVPIAFIAGGCVLIALVVVVFAYRIRASVHASGDSEDEDDDDELASTSRVRSPAETAALMDGEDDSLKLNPTRRRSVQADDLSLFGYLLSLVQSAEKTKQKNKKAPLMHRRNNGVKKIHKPYFYPLLDETAQWYADWETRNKLQAATKPADETVDARIGKPSPDASPASPLEGLDCVSLVSFRSSSHTIIPVAAI